MKRIQSLSLLLVVLLTLLVAASGSGVAQENITLNFSGHWNIELSIFDYFREYEQLNPHIKVDFTLLSSSRMLELLTVRHAGGALPDIMSVPGRIVPDLVELGIMAPVPAHWERRAAEVYVPQALELGRYLGQLYAYPSEHGTSALVYNGRHLASAGIAETRPQTWDELFDLARKLTLSENGQTTRPGFGIVRTVGTGVPMLAMLGSYFWSNGANFVSVEGSKLTPLFNSPEVLEAVEYYHEMQQLGIGDVIWGAGEFASGQMSLSIPQGAWWRSTIVETAGPEAYAEMGSWVTPPGRSGQPGTYQYAWVFGASTSTQHVDAAHEFMLWLLTAENQRGRTRFYEFGSTLGALPTTPLDIEAHRNGILQEKYMGGFLEGFLTSPLYLDPMVPQIGPMLQLFARGGYDVYYNGMAPVESLNAVQQEALARLSEGN